MLYGDGVHDDTEGLQALLDEHRSCARFPLPEKRYIVSRPLVIHARQQLTLDRFCEIALADGANCPLLVNEGYFSGETDADIEITGGVWNLNNMGQAPNPYHIPHPHCPEYDGIGIFFRRVKGLRVADMTLKDPVTFALTLNIVDSFTVERIRFDFNHGNPFALNMDGVHLDGHCRYGVIRDIKGACYDDMIALNADEGEPGPIEDILIDGLLAEGCHSAVRLLACMQRVDRIHITNVFGTCYQYCVGITKYYKDPTDGGFGTLSLDHIYASKALRPDWCCPKGVHYPFVYPFIWVEHALSVERLHIRDLYRVEKTVATPTLQIERGARIGSLLIESAAQENKTGAPFPFIYNMGRVDRLSVRDAAPGADEMIKNEGEIALID